MVAGAVPSLSVGWWSVFGGSWVGSNVVGESVVGVRWSVVFNAPLRETG